MSSAGALAGRVALVTGATGTIGQRVCAQLADAGARVIAQYRSSSVVVEQFTAGTSHIAVRADFAQPDWAAALTEAVVLAGRVDILVNSAHPAAGTARAAEQSVDLLRAHLEAVVLHSELCALVVPGMRRLGWGRIVFVSGALTVRPAEGRAAYAAAKSAAETLTRYLAWEEGRAGINANIVAPGRVVDPLEPEPELLPEWAELARDLVGRTSLGRFPTPDEVAHAVVALARPESSVITGQTVRVTGGEALWS